MSVLKLLFRQIWCSSLFLGLKLAITFFHYGESIQCLGRQKHSKVLVLLFHKLKRRDFEVHLVELAEEKLVEERFFFLFHKNLS